MLDEWRTLVCGTLLAYCVFAERKSDARGGRLHTAGSRPAASDFAGNFNQRSDPVSIGLILLIVLVLLLIGVFPTWPHSTGYGYGPSGIVGAILVVVVILLLLGRL